MRIFLNVWWHLTLGFVLALAYAVMGLFYCCTVILFPVGLGWLQFAKFLLAPHTSAMVPKSDLALLTGKSQGTAMKTYSLIIRILYFPFGLVASLSAIGMTVAYCIGYIGMMYLYGKGGFEQDFDEAYKNILSAPDELPFLVHKGDLVLYLKRDGSPYTFLSRKNITDIDLIRKANRYYGMAADAAPDIDEYRIRKEVTDAFIDAYEKTPSEFWTNNRSRFWTTYYFNNSDGAYYGVAAESGNTTYPNGWGVFSWDTSNSFRMTRYSGLKETNSPGIYINSDYTVGVGKIDNDSHLSEGVVTSPDGVKTVVNSR